MIPLDPTIRVESLGTSPGSGASYVISIWAMTPLAIVTWTCAVRSTGGGVPNVWYSA